MAFRTHNSIVHPKAPSSLVYTCALKGLLSPNFGLLCFTSGTWLFYSMVAWQDGDDIDWAPLERLLSLGPGCQGPSVGFQSVIYTLRYIHIHIYTHLHTYIYIYVDIMCICRYVWYLYNMYICTQISTRCMHTYLDI